MAARKRWRRYIPDDEISVRAFLHLIGRLFYYVGLHSEYFLLNFGRGARVGSTGNSTGNHCHFEIQVNGQWTDTRRYVMP